MDKTISITIAGLIFHIESSAYQRLETWLTAVRRHFTRYDDSDEILRDIETRIAEILNYRTEGGKRAVTLEGVDDVIAQIGTVEDFQDFEGEGTGATEAGSAGTGSAESGTATEEAAVRKRLYRDPDNSVLGGVAAGVAAYFGIDIVLTRILFIVFALIWGTSIVIYIILWIAMPVADTPAKKLEMRGKPVTLSGIEEKIKTSMPPREEVKSAFGRFMYKIADVLREIGEATVDLVKRAGPVLLSVIGAILVIGGAIAALSLTILFILMLTGTANVWFGVSPAQFATSPISHYALVVSTFLLVVIPAILILMAGIALIRGQGRPRKQRNSTIPIVMLSIWVIALLATTILGAREIPSYQQNIQSHISGLEQTERTFDLSPFTTISVSGGHEVVIIPSEEHYVKAFGDEQVLDQQLLVQVISRELVVNNSRSCLFCNNRSARLEIGVTEPRELKFSGATRTSLNGFDLENLTLRISGASRLDSDSDISELTTRLSGSTFASFTGHITHLECRLSGASRHRVVQSLETVRARISGASRIELGEVARLLDAELSGGSILEFSGEPEQSDIRSTSGSRVVPR